MRADMCSKCLVTDPCVRSFMIDKRGWLAAISYYVVSPCRSLSEGGSPTLALDLSSAAINLPQRWLTPQSKSKSRRGDLSPDYFSGHRRDAKVPPAFELVIRGEAELGLQCGGAHAFDAIPEMAGNDRDSCADAHRIEKIRHVARSHSDATITRRSAN